MPARQRPALAAPLHCLAIVALVLATAACSTATRVAYNNAPVAVAWVVDDWFDLHEGQRDWVKERLARLLAWHRANELPAYEKLLQDTAARSATRLSEGDFRRIYGEMRELYRRLLRQAIPDMAEFLLQLHPEQVAYLERKFTENNDKAVRESGGSSPLERREARVKRFLGQIDDWTGRLSAAQRELVRSRVAAMPDLAADWMADRRYRQAETLALLRGRGTREAMVAGLTRLLLETDTWRRPAYVAALRERDEQIFALLAALDATLTPEQREKMRRRLGGYAADVAYLMVAS
jgi:hypothetical protein